MVIFYYNSSIKNGWISTYIAIRKISSKALKKISENELKITLFSTVSLLALTGCGGGGGGGIFATSGAGGAGGALLEVCCSKDLFQVLEFFKI